MLRFQKGSADLPSGNLLVYCRVRGPNPFHPEASMILSNIVVSFVSAPNNSFPVVIFPPGPLFNREEFQKLLSLNEAYDVIRVPDFEIPEGTAEDDYVKQRLEHLNQCVLEYVELCRRRVDTLLEKPPAEADITDIDSIEPDEEGALRTLTDSLDRAERGETIAEHDLRSALQVLYTHPQYDVAGFEAALRQPETLPIARLYVQKYRAVREEQYEEAAGLKARIEELESHAGS